MLNRTSLPSAFAAGMEDSDPVVLIPERWGQWAFGLALPSTLQGYLFFVLCLLILAFTMALHITLSAESMRLDRQLATLEEEYARVERINANLVWEISQSTSLADVHAQAVAAGYAPISEFKYVVVGSDESAAELGAEVATNAGQFSLAPSAANPVIVFGGAAATTAASTPQQSALIQTPGIALPPAGTEAADVADVVSQGMDASPAWRDTFSVEGLRAAADETWSWIRDRLPHRQ